MPPGAPDDAAKLKQQFHTLRQQAVNEAEGPGNALKRGDLRAWAPSVVEKSGRKQAHLRELFLRHWPAAIEKRLGQLRRINRKLVRCCPDWLPWDDSQLLQPPPGGRAGLLEPDGPFPAPASSQATDNKE